MSDIVRVLVQRCVESWHTAASGQTCLCCARDRVDALPRADAKLHHLTSQKIACKNYWRVKDVTHALRILCATVEWNHLNILGATTASSIRGNTGETR